jgi:hypothetical protein
MYITVQPSARSALAVFVVQLAWPLILLLGSVAFTASFFLLHTSQAYDNTTPGCLANGRAIFPWNQTVNEYWDPSTALSITLGVGQYTYPEAKAIDVAWDILVGRGGQFLAASFAWRVITKSLYLSMEEKPVPVALAFGVYFHAITFGLLGSILENLTLPFRSRKHKVKGVSIWRLLGWLYACAYVLLLPTIVSAMTGYQTAYSLFFHPLNSPSESLVGVTMLAPNPALVIRDGSRVGLEDSMVLPVPDDTTVIDTSAEDLFAYRYNETYSTILGCKS